MSESINPASARPDTPSALVLLVIALALVGALAPFAFLVCGPTLLVIGVRTLRSWESGTTRLVGWAAVALGAATLVIPAIALLGLVAVGGGDVTIVETVPR